MTLGIICNDFETKSFEKVKAMNLDFVEFCINVGDPKYQTLYDSADRINEDMSRLGLFVGSVGSWGYDKLDKSGNIIPENLHVIETLIKATSKLHCHVFITNCNYVEELSLFENYSAAIKYFEVLIALGKEYGVKIGTNNCRWNSYITCDPAWSVVHGHLKDLYMKYDPSHCIYAGGDYLSEMKKWGKRFQHIHIKGSMVIDGERFDDPPAGLDQTNWGAFMETLYAAGYDGTLSIEPHSGIWTGELGDKGVEYTIKYMRNLML